MEQSLSKEALELAKKISDGIWQRYDDTYGYQTEKREYNANVSTDNPDNIWFFWGQFDICNQEIFWFRVAESNEAGAEELLAWATEQLAKLGENLNHLRQHGVDGDGSADED